VSDATVRPALTADEWTRAVVRRTVDGGDETNTMLYVRDGVLHVVNEDSIDMEAMEAIVNSAAHHPLAALALHEQPFGFTRDDVKLLRGPAYSALLEVARDGEESALAEDALALASRIAALLPPEGP